MWRRGVTEIFVWLFVVFLKKSAFTCCKFKLLCDNVFSAGIKEKSIQQKRCVFDELFRKVIQSVKGVILRLLLESGGGGGVLCSLPIFFLLNHLLLLILNKVQIFLEL